MRTVGIVSPGAMGSAVADALSRGGARAVATTHGRSQRTSALAEKASVELLPDLASVVGQSEIILSIVPPEHAESVAAGVSARALECSVRPLVIDLNAIAPLTSRRVGEVVSAAGCEYVDGSISGPPPWQPGTTRIYLSGRRGREAAEVPIAGVERIVVGAELGMASAVKMSTASVYKGTSALLAHALLAAEANGVLGYVLDDLRAGSPELVANVAKRLATAATKSERYVGEMREIASTQSAAGLTPALFAAMAEVFSGLSTSELGRSAPEEILPSVDIRDVLGALRQV